MANSTTKGKNAGQASSTDDLGADDVQRQVDREEDKGYRGHVADPTPNSAYTVAGVTAGEPTPETDADLKREADARAVDPATATEGN